MRRPLFTLPIPADTFTALQKAGYRTYQDLFTTKSEPMTEVLNIFESTGFSWSQLEKLVNPAPASTATDILKNEKLCQTIPTLSEALDNILGGGIRVGGVIQICGAPGSGKTQLAMQLCLSVQIPGSLGSLNSSAVFIDSERGFSRVRLAEMGEALVAHCRQVGLMYDLNSDVQHLSVDHLLENVNYMEVTTHLELLSAINQLDSFLSQSKAKLVVVDSFILPLLALPNPLERVKFLARIMKQLQSLAVKHSTAVIVINDLTTWITASGDKQLVPALGETFSHLSPTILLLTSHNSYFYGLLYKSSSLPRNGANFKIQKEGIRD